MEQYLAFFQNLWLITKAFIFEWMPLYKELKLALWGPLKPIVTTISTITAFIGIAIAILKFWDNYIRD